MISRIARVNRLVRWESSRVTEGLLLAVRSSTDSTNAAVERSFVGVLAVLIVLMESSKT